MNLKNNTKNFSFLIILLLIGGLFLPTITALATTSDLDVSLLTQYPDPARAGDTFELRINVQNNGESYAEEILVEIVPEYPFSLVPGEKAQQKITNLLNWPKEGNFKTLTYKLLTNSDALDGQHKIKVRYSTNKGISWVEESFNVDVTSKEFAEIIYIDKTKIIPGQETQLSFTINNIGNAPLQNMVFSWNEPDDIILPVNTDNTRYIKYLAPNDKVDLEYTVIASVNADPDLYMLNLNLEYDVKNSSNADEKEILSTQAGVFVGGETDFDVAFSESSGGETSFSISNIGSVPAYSVSVVIPQQQGWKVSGSNSMIIGNLNKGDYTIASFNLQSAMPRNNAESSEEDEQKIMQSFLQDSQNLKIQVIYTDTMGQRNTVEKEVPLNPANLMSGLTTETGVNNFAGRGGMMQQESFFSKYKWYFIVLIVIIFLYFEKKRYQQRDDKKQKFIDFVKDDLRIFFTKIKAFFQKKKNPS